MKGWRIKTSICIGLGLAIAAYGILLLAGLESLSFGKYSAGARDTNIGLLILVFGGVLTLYGLFSPSVDKG
jgi:hypothetical protein